MPLYPSLTSIVLRNKAIRRIKRDIAHLYLSEDTKDQERFVRLSEQLDALYAEKVRLMRARNFVLVCAVCASAYV